MKHLVLVVHYFVIFLDCLLWYRLYRLPRLLEQVALAWIITVWSLRVSIFFRRKWCLLDPHILRLAHSIELFTNDSTILNEKVFHASFLKAASIDLMRGDPNLAELLMLHWILHSIFRAHMEVRIKAGAVFVVLRTNYLALIDSWEVSITISCDLLLLCDDLNWL